MTPRRNGISRQREDTQHRLTSTGDSASGVNRFGPPSWHSRAHTRMTAGTPTADRKRATRWYGKSFSISLETLRKRSSSPPSDVKLLECHVLEGGVFNRQEAEALLALDRSLSRRTRAGLGSIRALIVNFVVRRTLPSGTVTADDALWLTSALDLGGPTATPINIAYAILDEAQHVDIAILDFIMRCRQQARLQKMAA